MTISIVSISAFSGIFAPIESTNNASVTHLLSSSISEVCSSQLNNLKYSNSHLSHQHTLLHPWALSLHHCCLLCHLLYHHYLPCCCHPLLHHHHLHHWHCPLLQQQAGFTPESNTDTTIRIAQSEDSGLSIDDQSMLASLFSDMPNKAAVFHALAPREAHDMWIQRALEWYRSQ